MTFRTSLATLVAAMLTVPALVAQPERPAPGAPPATLPTPADPPATQKPPAPRPAPRAPEVTTPVTALMVEITVSRVKGDKAVSSVPYVLALLPDNERVTLRVGGQVPVQVAGPRDPDGKERPAAYSYRDVGTSIDVQAREAGDGRYRVSISVDESSVYAADDARPEPIGSAPAFRSLRSSNSVALRHGQRIEYIAATDRITGEVARVSVRLTVVP